MSRVAACACLALSMILVGANVPFTKDIAGHIPPLHFALLRFVIAGVALAPLALSAGISSQLSLFRNAGWQVAAMAVVGMIGFTLFLIAGLKQTSAMNAGVIMASLPGMVTIFGVAFMGDRPRTNQLIGVACAIAGVGIIQLAQSGPDSGTLTGNLLIVSAVMCEAMFVILAKQLAEQYAPVALAFAANLIAFAIMVPVLLLVGETLKIASVPVYIWPLMVWYALAASVLSLLLWYRGLPIVETSVAGIFTAALPVTALIVSAIYLGETIGLAQALGAGIVITGIFIGARSLGPLPSP